MLIRQRVFTLLCVLGCIPPSLLGAVYSHVRVVCGRGSD